VVVLTVVFVCVAVVGMELGEMVRVRPVIERFAAEVFADLPRRDQRGKGGLYVRGLLTDGKRKSMVPMAARLGVDPQQLQQFVTSSTWDYRQVRRRLAGWAAAFLDPVALVVDDTGFPKDGPASPGVARMYSGTLGKAANCQIGVSVHAVTDWASAAVDWRLFLPTSWDDTAVTDPAALATAQARRERAAIPDTARHQEKWRLALDIKFGCLRPRAGRPAQAAGKPPPTGGRAPDPHHHTPSGSTPRRRRSSAPGRPCQGRLRRRERALRAP
jgi:SRSO17 transposase